MVNKKEQKFYHDLGLRLMMQRQSRKISQEKLGAFLGVSGQQVQRYEHGKDRISSARLYQCTKVLSAPIAYFFGEGEAVNLRQYDKNILLIASEIDALPEGVNRSIMHHVRMIDKALREASNDNERP